MTTLSDKIAAAKAAPRDFQDVTVSLNKNLSEQREALEAALSDAKTSNDDRLGAPTAASLVQAKLDALLNEAVDTLVTLRFTVLPGDVWASLTRLCPPNPGIIMDRHFGYSMDDVAKLAAKFVGSDGTVYGHAVDGDALAVPVQHPVTKTNLKPTNEWDEMFSLMSGPEFGTVVDTIYGLNIDAPNKRLNAAKKHLASLTA